MLPDSRETIPIRSSAPSSVVKDSGNTAISISMNRLKMVDIASQLTVVKTAGSQIIKTSASEFVTFERSLT